MIFQFPEPEIRARSSSSYTIDNINKRLQALSDKEDDESMREKQYLNKLLQKELLYRKLSS